MSLKLLRDRKAALVKEAASLGDKEATAPLSAEDEARYDAIEVELAAVNKGIVRAEALDEQKRSMVGVAVDGDTPAVAETPAVVAPAQPVALPAWISPYANGRPKPFSAYVDETRLRNPTPALLPAEAKKQPGKFKSFGEQLRAIAVQGMTGNGGNSTDNRLVYQNTFDAAASGLDQSVPSEGGYLVQTDFTTALLDMMHDMGDVLGRVRKIPIAPTSNGIKIPAIDETSRVDGSRWGGVQSFWADEADTVTSSKPKFREMELRLKKLFGLGYATDELLADAGALESVLGQAFAEELTFKTENGIVNGTGSGQMLGIVNSGALIVVNKDAGQATLTLSTTNILNMWTRMPRRNRKNAVWLVNQDIEPALYQLTLGTGTAVMLLYAPPGTSGNQTPYGRLLGCPVIPVEYCASFTNQGDIMLVDLTQYLMIDKGGPQSAQSMHVRFLFDEMTFRFIYRLDGQPAWRAPVTPFKGTNTQSPFITLQAR